MNSPVHVRRLCWPSEWSPSTINGSLTIPPMKKIWPVKRALQLCVIQAWDLGVPILAKELAR